MLDVSPFMGRQGLGGKRFELDRRRMNHQLLRQFPKLCPGFLFLRILRHPKNAREHADDIAVQNGRRLVERNAANRAGGVTANARQREHVVKAPRKLAVVLGHDLPRRLLQVPGARVIAESFPQLVDLVRTCLGRRCDGRQFAHPPFPVRNDRLYLRLLEHDFGYKDRIGVLGPSPRQIPRVFRIPLQQPRNDGGDFSLMWRHTPQIQGTSVPAQGRTNPLQTYKINQLPSFAGPLCYFLL